MPDVVAVIFQCIRSENNVLVYLATVVIRAAIKLAAEPGTTEGGSLLRQEFANRLMVLSADNLQQLVACLHTHSLARNNSLQVVGLLDTLALALNSPSVDNDTGRMWLKAFEASMMAAADIFCAVSRSPSAAILKRYHLLFSTSIFSDESNNNGSTDLPFKYIIFLPVRPFLWSQLTSI
jgi:DnaJ family protein C protein 13